MQQSIQIGNSIDQNLVECDVTRCFSVMLTVTTINIIHVKHKNKFEITIIIQNEQRQLGNWIYRQTYKMYGWSF